MLVRALIITIGIISTLLGITLAIIGYSVSFIGPVLIGLGVVTLGGGILAKICKFVPLITAILIIVGITHVSHMVALLVISQAVLPLALTLNVMGIALIALGILLFVVPCRCHDD